MKNKKYLYIFTRKDLTPSQIAVQSIHAAFEMGRILNREEEHPSVVLLRAKNEEELTLHLGYIKAMGFVTVEFIEPHYHNSLTSFAIEPINEEERSVLKRFKLMQNTDFSN